MTDSKEMKCETVYSKTPIDIDVFPYDGPIDDETVIAAGGIQNLTQKYFKDLPNPDFGRTHDEPLHDDFVPIRWDVELPTLSWCSLNHYETEDYFNNFRNDIGAQMAFFEDIKENWQLVLNHDKIALYARHGKTYFSRNDKIWSEGLYFIMITFLQNQHSLASLMLSESVED